jgi:hypothetical protein
MMKLIEAANKREKGSIIRWTHYFEAYDFHFEKLQNETVKLLEIGVMGGGSLWMWKKYFEKGQIVGLDCDSKCLKWAGEGVKVYVGDQADVVRLCQIHYEDGPFDIIIDDGSHKMRDQQLTFSTLFPLMKDGGIYVIEDLHTSFWPPWLDEDGVERTLNVLYRHAEGLQGWAKRSHEARELIDHGAAGYFERNISSMHFYDSICFIYKNGHGKNAMGEGGMYHG